MLICAWKIYSLYFYQIWTQWLPSACDVWFLDLLHVQRKKSPSEAKIFSLRVCFFFDVQAKHRSLWMWAGPFVGFAPGSFTILWTVPLVMPDDFSGRIQNKRAFLPHSHYSRHDKTLNRHLTFLEHVLWWLDIRWLILFDVSSSALLYRQRFFERRTSLRRFYLWSPQYDCWVRWIICTSPPQRALD